jgi:hypothetical protein
LTRIGRLYLTSAHGNYVDAFIFDTRSQMYDYLRDQGHNPNDCAAMCLAFTKYNVKGNLTKHVGTLCFYQERLGAGIVAHECSHAAFNAMRREYPHYTFDYGTLCQSDVIPVEHPEEYFCLALGNLVTQFWNSYYDQGGQPNV